MRAEVALHREPAEWKRLYGEDVEWIGWVEAWKAKVGGQVERR